MTLNIVKVYRTRIREPLRSSAREDPRMRSHGTPSAAGASQVSRNLAVVTQAGRMLAVVIQAGRILAVVIGQAPRRRKVGESRVPSAARRKGVVRRWRVIVGSQAAKARPHNPRREVVAVAAVVVVAVAVAAVAAVAAAEEDKEGITCIPTRGKTKSGY
jgi:hypothetical protein